MTSQIKKDTQKIGKYKVNGENTSQCTWTEIEFPKSLRVSFSECMGGSSYVMKAVGMDSYHVILRALYCLPEKGSSKPDEY